MSNFRPGDWTCSACKAHNFASRSLCYKCRNPKEGGSSGGGGGGGGGGGVMREPTLYDAEGIYLSDNDAVMAMPCDAGRHSSTDHTMESSVFKQMVIQEGMGLMVVPVGGSGRRVQFRSPSGSEKVAGGGGYHKRQRSHLRDMFGGPPPDDDDA
mmetsp:Transcript_12188/g.24615  ORF Transcript_12188/g.24615 Transcript_12188/m.24615 type:complete len:154 (+) Transcript_12188:54-515(+)